MNCILHIRFNLAKTKSRVDQFHFKKMQMTPLKNSSFWLVKETIKQFIITLLGKKKLGLTPKSVVCVYFKKI